MPIMNAPMETCSDTNELQIVSHNSLFSDEISLFSPIIIMPAFGNWSFIEKFCSINYTNNLRGFALISVLNISLVTDVLILPSENLMRSLENLPIF